MFVTTATIQSIIRIPGTGGGAATSFFCDFLFKPASCEKCLVANGKKGKVNLIMNVPNK